MKYQTIITKLARNFLLGQSAFDPNEKCASIFENEVNVTSEVIQLEFFLKLDMFGKYIILADFNSLDLTNAPLRVKINGVVNWLVAKWRFLMVKNAARTRLVK